MPKRRQLFTAVSVLCIVAQLVLGASSALGLVLCVAVDHAAVERPSDHCCSGHGATTVIEASCCDDLPLVSAWRSLADVRRDHAASLPVTLVATASSILPAVAASTSLPAPAAGSAPPLALRPAILRV